MNKDLMGDQIVYYGSPTTLSILNVDLEVVTDNRVLLLEELNRAFDTYTIKIKEDAQEYADKILSDMQKDSYAYCLGYFKGAHVLLQVINKLLDESNTQLDAPMVRSALKFFLMKAIDQLPPPNPDDHGFGKPRS